MILERENTEEAIKKKITPNELQYAPKPPLAFRVGAVAYLPVRLKNANYKELKCVLHDILQVIQYEVSIFGRDHKELFSQTAPVLRAISPLAEGADRLFAEQAIDLGWELNCIMPFHQEEYEKDFTNAAALVSDSLERYFKLLARAEAKDKLKRFELNGSRDESEVADGKCRRVVLNQSDIFIVIGDGLHEDEFGGTEEPLNEAIRQGIPVIWVDTCAPHTWQIIQSSAPKPPEPNPRSTPDGSGMFETLRKVVRELLMVPEPQIREDRKTAPGTNPELEKNGILSFLTDNIILNTSKRCWNKIKSLMGVNAETPYEELMHFYNEKKPAWTLAVIWKAFRDIVAERSFPKVCFRPSPFEDAAKDKWPESTATPADEMVNRLRPFFAWPDQLSILYSNRYRSTFIIVFLLAATAVAMALAPVGFHLPIGPINAINCTRLELMSIGVILLVVYLGHKGKWHERWIDNRLAAELLRHLRIVNLMGGERSFPGIPAHHEYYGHPSATWIGWYVRAVTRSIGLPEIKIDQEYLKTSLVHINNLLADQLNYHLSNSSRCENIERRLHQGTVFLLLLTGLSCILHLCHFDHIESLLTFFCGFFPSLGASLAGINNQGEFRRLTHRSKAMISQLTILQERINLLINPLKPESEIPPSEASDIAGELARLLVNEVLDWRVVFLDRPLEVGP